MTRRRPAYAPAPPMSDAQHTAITRELVRLTIAGGRDRPELLDRVETERLARRRKYRPSATLEGTA